MEWKPYPRDRLVAEHPSGFVIIKPAEDEPPVPIGCSVCGSLMRSRDDEVSYHEHSCCYRCALHWAHPRRKEWKEGWRPTPEQVAKLEEDRPPLVVKLDID